MLHPKICHLNKKNLDDVKTHFSFFLSFECNIIIGDDHKTCLNAIIDIKGGSIEDISTHQKERIY